jgi:hypothetical protein
VKLSRIFFFVLALLFCSSVVVFSLADRASFVSAQSVSAPTIVQFSEGTASGGSGASLQFTFGSQVTQGDRILLCLGVVSTNSVELAASTPSDSLGTVFTSIVTSQGGPNGPPGAFAEAWLGVVPTTGNDTIMENYASGPAGIFGYEISGSVNSVTSGEGASSGTYPSTSGSVIPYPSPVQSLIIACGGYYKSGGLTPGLGYTLDAENFPPGDVDNGAEHGISNGGLVSSPVQFGFLVDNWAEVSVGLSSSSASFTTYGVTITTTVTQVVNASSIVTVTLPTVVTTTQQETSVQLVQVVSATTVTTQNTVTTTLSAQFLSDPATQILFVVAVLATVIACSLAGVLALKRQVMPR